MRDRMRVLTISIHALREEGDKGSDEYKVGDVVFLSTPSARRATVPVRLLAAVHHGISIHALREEGDAQFCDLLGNIGVFLSTPSARRATRWCRCTSRSP